MTDIEPTERTLPPWLDRPDAVLGVIACLFVAAAVAATLSSLAALPVLGVGCLGCVAVIGDALFVNPPVEG